MQIKNLKIRGSKKLWIWWMIIFISSSIVSISSSTILSLNQGNSLLRLWFKHEGFLIVGTGIIYLISTLKHKHLSIIFSLTDIIFLGSLVLLLATNFIGVQKGDARRWISIFGFTFQSSEFTKLGLIMYVAKELTLITKSKKGQNIHIRNILLATGTAVFLIGIHNLSGALIVAAVIVGMLLVSEIDKETKFFLTKVVVGAGILVAALIIVLPSDVGRVGTWKSRVERKLTNDVSVTDQSVQALVAFAKGGWLSWRMGRGEQKGVIPQSYSDYIFASIIGEEFGALFGILIVIMYTVLFFLVSKLIYRLKRIFLLYLSIGFALSITIQAFVHILVNINIFPVTGQPLPFISIGGSSILINSVMLGFIILASSYTDKTMQKVSEVNNDPVDYEFERNKIIIG